MSFNINLPIAGLRNKNAFGDIAYFLMGLITLTYISQAYRIFLKSSDILLQIRVTEDYALICLLFISMMLRGSLRINNFIPFALLFAYLCLNYLIVISDFDLVRRFIIIMLWYTIAINILTKIKIEYFFYVVCFLGIFSAGMMIINVEQTIAMYVLESQRIHSEGEGMDLNINNITLILVALTAVATVLKSNVQYIRYGKLLILTLYLSVAIIILIGATRSALLFYLILVFYSLFKMSAKLIIIPFLFIVIAISGSILFIGELVVVSRIIDFDFQSSGRILAMRDSISNFVNYPLFGVGELYQETKQIQRIGDPDHNFYSRLLGSNGLIGFIFVTLFLYGMTRTLSKGIKGMFILKGFFFFTFFFTPAGPGALVAASTIYYLSDLKNRNYSN